MSSAEEHKDKSIETELFYNFLNESFDEEQLAFFLLCRKDCLKVGSSVQVQTRDLLESYFEFYLDFDNLERLLRTSWWNSRYNKNLLIELTEYAVERPAVHLDASKKYISTHQVLYFNVIKYAEDKISRLNELFSRSRIIPRLKKKQFERLCLRLIPGINQAKILEFHRSTVTKSKRRFEINLEDFIEKFTQSSILMKSCRSPSQLNLVSLDLHHTIFRFWQKFKNEITRILDYFQHEINLRPENSIAKSYFEEAIRHRSMMLHSFNVLDGELGAMHLFEFLIITDLLFTTVRDIEPDVFRPSLVSLECAIRECWNSFENFQI